MSDASSDSFSAFDFSEYSHQALALVDQSIERAQSQCVQADTDSDASFQWEIDSGALDLSGLNEDDFMSIDAIIAQKISLDNQHSSTGTPAIAIQLEATATSGSQSASTKGKTRQLEYEPPPIERYRPKGILSVTDLVSPAWCEVQFDYGLRGKRSRPIETRPKSFKSAAGKEIRVESAVAAVNDKTTKQGRAIHKELEREVHAEELQVEITTEEERWALRLVNMIASVQSIIMTGFTREIPVFGLVYGEVVVGIIDEVSLTAVEATAGSSRTLKRTADYDDSRESSKRARRTTSLVTEAAEPLLASHRLDASSSNVPSDDSSETPLQQRLLQQLPQPMLRITDTKTRRTDSLPLHVDTISSRLQLMLYHRLLDGLTSTSTPFDFPSFWNRLKLNSAEAFSTRFLLQTHLSLDKEQHTTCLDDLARSWANLVKVLDISGIDPTLQLVYRRQPPLDPKGKRKRLSSSSHSGSLTRQELDDIAKAMATSLEATAPGNTRIDEVQTNNSGSTPDAQETVGESSRNSRDKNSSEDSAGEDIAMQWALLNSLLPPGADGQGSYPELVNRNLSIGEKIPHESVEYNGIDHLKIIGTKEFQNDPAFLDAHLLDVLQWWKGERRPRGVPIKLVRRCNSCEYQNDCEWREEKATEIMERKTLEASTR